MGDTHELRWIALEHSWHLAFHREQCVYSTGALRKHLGVIVGVVGGKRTIEAVAQVQSQSM